jgi:hypothetical protein
MTFPTVLNLGPAGVVAVAEAVPEPYSRRFTQFEFWSNGQQQTGGGGINFNFGLGSAPELLVSPVGDDTPSDILDLYYQRALTRATSRLLYQLTLPNWAPFNFGIYYDEDAIRADLASVQFHFDEYADEVPGYRGYNFLDFTKDVRTNANALIARLDAISRGIRDAVDAVLPGRGAVTAWPGVRMDINSPPLPVDSIRDSSIVSMCETHDYILVNRYTYTSNDSTEHEIIRQGAQRYAPIAASTGVPLFMTVRPVIPSSGALIPYAQQQKRFRVAIQNGCTGIAIWEGNQANADRSAIIAEIAHEEAEAWRAYQSASAGLLNSAKDNAQGASDSSLAAKSSIEEFQSSETPSLLDDAIGDCESASELALDAKEDIELFEDPPYTPPADYTPPLA